MSTVTKSAGKQSKTSSVDAEQINEEYDKVDQEKDADRDEEADIVDAVGVFRELVLRERLVEAQPTASEDDQSRNHVTPVSRLFVFQ